MADRWMDERDRRWRERDWRRSEDYRSGGRDEGRFLSGEDRSWGASSEDDRGAYGGRYGGQDRDRVFGERETGTGYGGEDTARGGMRPGGAYGGESYSPREYRYGGGRGSAYRGGSSGQGWRSGSWQDRDYGGVSPAMQQGEYDAERQAERYGQSGYDEGGRYYGDAGRERIYRQEYGQGGVEYGEVPRGYDAAGGGYGYERGYGEGGRQRYRGGQFGLPPDEGRWQERERGERWERGGREAGDFFRRAGERVASWFGGGETERRDERDFRGMGPKGYKRADERISDEAHERLTEDPWVDATNIAVSVASGEVTLSGTVESREAKHRAERCVEDVSGVTHVQNNLRVERGNPLTSPGSGYGDSVLQHQMRGETGAGEHLGGSAVAGSGSTGATTTGSARSAGSTGPDAGKSR